VINRDRYSFKPWSCSHWSQWQICSWLEEHKAIWWAPRDSLTKGGGHFGISFWIILLAFFWLDLQHQTMHLRLVSLHHRL